MTANVKRALTRSATGWTPVIACPRGGGGWQGKRRCCDWWAGAGNVVSCCCAASSIGRWCWWTAPSRNSRCFSFAEIGPDREVWEYAALVTSLDVEILTLGQLYRDRGDCENSFDELKNQWGWGGFTTHDHRVKPGAGSEAVPAARRQRRADLQLVEPVRPSG